MNTVERHKHILEKIQQEGQIKVQYICETMDISPVTARKDLKFLEEKGLEDKFQIMSPKFELSIILPYLFL